MLFAKKLTARPVRVCKRARAKYNKLIHLRHLGLVTSLIPFDLLL